MTSDASRVIEIVATWTGCRIPVAQPGLHTKSSPTGPAEQEEGGSLLDTLAHVVSPS